MQAYDKLAEDLSHRAANLNKDAQFWLGLAGAPGSGKSTLAAALRARLPTLLVVIPMDGYHFSRSKLDTMNNPAHAHARRGAPYTFDSRRFVADLIKAKRKARGYFPSFDHRAGDPVENSITLSRTHKIVLVEGNYLLLNSKPWNRLKDEVFDETWFLDVPIATCSQRVMDRHMKIGMKKKQAQLRASTNDRINAELIARQSPRRADRLIYVS